MAVQPCLGFPVAGADDEENPLAAILLRSADRARIPGDRRLVRDSGQRRAPGEGNHDGVRKIRSARKPFRLKAGILPVEPELPVAIQVDPGRPFEIRTRVFW